MINIRAIEQKDNQVLASVIRSVFDKMGAPTAGTVYVDPTTDQLFEFFQQEKKAVLYIAEKDGRVVGSCGIYPTKGLPEGYAELVKYYIDMDFQGQGIGGLLLQKSLEAAKQMGYQQLYLESLPAFAGAIQIYLNKGFIKLEAPLGNSGHPGCTIWMLKTLS